MVDQLVGTVVAAEVQLAQDRTVAVLISVSASEPPVKIQAHQRALVHQLIGPVVAAEVQRAQDRSGRVDQRVGIRAAGEDQARQRALIDQLIGTVVATEVQRPRIDPGLC